MYAYCLNNPVKYFDPDGYVALVDDLLIFGGSAIIMIVVILLIPPPPATLGLDLSQKTVEPSIIDREGEQQTDSERRSLPPKGDPNSDDALLNPDGSVKQWRHYDSNEQASFDVDYNHTNGDNSHKFPHVHVWSGGQRIEESIDFWSFFNLLVEYL